MRIKTVFFAASLAVFGATPALAQNGHDLFQQALVQEQAEGNLRSAIVLYSRVVSEFPLDRPLVARALVQTGRAYEMLGDGEAQQAYERVLRDYPDQPEQVVVARSRLAALDQPRSSADPATMVVRRVWSGRDAFRVGGVSPEGRYLSYLNRSGGGLAIHDLETGNDRPLANEDSWSRGNVFANSHKLSPDGQQVAYVWLNEDSFNEVRIVGLDGSEPRVLYRNEETSRRVWDIATANHIVQRAVLAWSPDGKYVLVTFRREDRSNQLGLVSVADGSVRVLKTLGGVPPIGVSFSPDGRYIAYDLPAGDSAERDIFLLATDGSRETPLIEHPANDQFPMWTPDGKRILFVSDRTGNLGAWLIQVADGKPQGSPELVKSGIGPIWPLGFTRDGSFYYRLSTGTMFDVYTAALDPATGTLLSSPQKVSQPFVGSNSQPDWSPDGQYLAYFRQQGPLPIQASVMIRSVETGEVRELPRQLYIQYYRGLRWSPDGRSILVKGSNNRRWGLYELDAQTGAVTPIVQTTGAGGSRPEYSPDGRGIFYWRGSRGTTRIVARDLESGEERDLLHAVPPSWISHIMVVSPDGQRLAFLMEDRDTQSMALKVMPAAGGEPRELLRVHRPDFFNLGNYSALAWTPDGRALIYGKRTAASGTLEAAREGGAKVELWRISAEGGTPQRVGLAMDRLSHLRFHPDGRRIVFDAVDARPENNEVWVMEHFLPELSATP